MISHGAFAALYMHKRKTKSIRKRKQQNIPNKDSNAKNNKIVELHHLIKNHSPLSCFPNGHTGARLYSHRNGTIEVNVCSFRGTKLSRMFLLFCDLSSEVLCPRLPWPKLERLSWPHLAWVDGTRCFTLALSSEPWPDAY